MSRRQPNSEPGLRQAGGPIPDRHSIVPGLFSQFQRLIYDESGIWLGEHKHALLTGRLAKRLRLLGLGSMHEYFELVIQPDQTHERAVMIDCITTNQTHFFREPRHFDFLSQEIFPRWQHDATVGDRPKHIRVWSAGCSSGEEPYSLAMLLLKYFPVAEGWDLEVLATDICTKVLDRARAGIYSIEKVKEIPPELLHAYMLKGKGDQKGLMKVSPEIHRIVRFARVNLHADSYPVLGAFDLIFCRNVLIYFDQKSKEKVISGLVRHLAPHGLLLVGHSEHLGSISAELKNVAPTIYVHASKREAFERMRKGASAGDTQ